jgi:hypothetical protein
VAGGGSAGLASISGSIKKDRTSEHPPHQPSRDPTNGRGFVLLHAPLNKGRHSGLSEVEGQNLCISLLLLFVSFACFFCLSFRSAAEESASRFICLSF